MSIQTVNLGTYANDGTGDDLRAAFEKVIGNFDYLDIVKIEDGENLGLTQPNTHGVYAGLDGTTLQFKSIKQGDNVAITSNGSTITIRPKDSINAVEEDPNPKLGGDLDTAGYDIFSQDLPLEIRVENNYLNIINYNTDTGNYLPLALNALTLTGNNFNTPGVTTLATYPDDGLVINSDLQLVLTSNNGVLIDTDLTVSNGITATSFTGPLTGNVTGNLTGNSAGTHTGPVFGDVAGDVVGNLTGNVTGNVLGQVSDISNHFLRNLGDVTNNLPGSGNVLAWNGTAWAPTDLGPSVSQIIPGTNISISPGGGTGVVTINAVIPASSLDNLTDVVITTPTAEQVLKYNGTAWINAATPPTVSILDDLTDVVVASPAADEILQYNGTAWVNTPFNLEQSLLNFDLGVIGANITSPLQLIFQALHIDFNTFDLPADFNLDLGTLGPDTGPVEWTSGDIDGDDVTPTFEFYVDGGGAGTTVFTSIADGGDAGYVPLEWTSGDVDAGGSSTTLFEYYIDSGVPSTTVFAGTADGGVSPPVSGLEAYITPGTYSWIAPDGVTSVCVVAVGGGASGGCSNTTSAGTTVYAGGGGGLGWKNNIAVTPGQSYTVVVGAGGVPPNPRAEFGNPVQGELGEDSYFINTSTVMGGGGRNDNTFSTYIGDGGGRGGRGPASDSGRDAGAGGGGAGGYSGDGGDGALNWSSGTQTAGAGGGGSGGEISWGGQYSGSSATAGHGGGGVGIYGEGASGAIAVTSGVGQGGSGGENAPLGDRSVGDSFGKGGNYGGGGGMWGQNYGSNAWGGTGGDGAVRIVWGAGVSFPNNAT
jgi:hypothetical protein